MSYDPKSILLNTDSYKSSMKEQYPANTEHVFSHILSRGGIEDEVVFMGMQIFIQEVMLRKFTAEDIDFAASMWSVHGEPFPEKEFRRMLEKHNGYLPMEIRGVPEGTVVPVKNILASVVNTDKEFPWITTWIEPPCLRSIWFATTVATNSRAIKKLIAKYLNISGTPESIDFKLHDFGARGSASFESAGIGALAHAISFKGSDTMTGNVFGKFYYDSDMLTYSIPASEHSTITSWGRANEIDAFKNMVTKFTGYPVVACVSDSYDIYQACHMWGSLKDEIKKANMTLVVRPDSGDPLVVIPKCLEILSQYFGTTVNEKGYKVLDSVRLIWGDGINKLTIESILRTVVNVLGYSADMVAFGMGGALLQNITRDDQKFAMKCSAISVDGVWRDVYKDPITDPGKRSQAGVLTLRKIDGQFKTVATDWTKDEFVTWYRKDETSDEPSVYFDNFENIRTRAAI